MAPRRQRRQRGASQAEFAANLDIRECDNCNAQYNLAGQSYYGPLCPDCNREADEL